MSSVRADLAPSLRELRLVACRRCPDLRPGLARLLDRCRLCGCFVEAKAALRSERCPAGKW